MRLSTLSQGAVASRDVRIIDAAGNQGLTIWETGPWTLLPYGPQRSH